MKTDKIGLILAQRAQVASRLCVVGKGAHTLRPFSLRADKGHSPQTEFFARPETLSVSPKKGKLAVLFSRPGRLYQGVFVFNRSYAFESIKSVQGRFQRAFLVAWTGEAERQLLLKRYNVFWRGSARLKAQAWRAFPGFPGSPGLALVDVKMSPHLVKGSYGENFNVKWEQWNDRKTNLYDVLSCRVQGQGLPYPGWE